MPPVAVARGRRLAPTLVAVTVIVATVLVLGDARGQSPEDLARKVVTLEDRIDALQKQVTLLSQQLAALRGPIQVSASGVEIRTGSFTVEAGKISLRSSGELELKGSKVHQN